MEIQKARDNAQQIQAQNIVILQGIDEKRAREIYDEKYSIARKDFTQEALTIANERVKELENRLIPKIKAIDNGLKAFADPSFQLLLVEAQKSAAATERVEDYDLLSELLIHRIEKGNDRHIRTGIHRAIEIVEDISDEALLALTVVHSVTYFMPRATEINDALRTLDDLFKKIIYSELPSNNAWLDHLDILDAIRINHFSKFKTIEEYYTHSLNGIAVIGIRKNSEQYERAKKLLQDAGLPVFAILVDNALNHDFVRISIGNINGIEELHLIHIIKGNQMINPLNQEQKSAINSVLKLYLKDNNLQQEINKSFMDEWIKHPYLLKLKNWFEKIPYSFDVTSVGKVLAHANAQRCDKTLPSMNF